MREVLSICSTYTKPGADRVTGEMENEKLDKSENETESENRTARVIKQDSIARQHEPKNGTKAESSAFNLRTL